VSTAAVSIRPIQHAEAGVVLALYRAAAAQGGGLARTPDEITKTYVDGFLAKAADGGLSLGAWTADGVLCGEIHVGRMGPAQFSHVLTDLTVAVHPDWQGRGVGRRLFEALIAASCSVQPPAWRIELAAREGNTGAIRLYERLGFQAEGRLVGRVRLPDGLIEDDIPMALMLDRVSPPE
jgi:ribosomal protein S18 acetylase RimI-like enzyme